MQANPRRHADADVINGWPLIRRPFCLSDDDGAEAAAEPTLTVDLPLRSDQDIGLPPSKIPQTAKAAGLRTNFAPRAFVVRDARFMLPVLEGETGKVF